MQNRAPAMLSQLFLLQLWPFQFQQAQELFLLQPLYGHLQ
uniref:Uncharacterized protein n=1 Tax=Arundo donax TaxID=35708 RepID=A0A0A9EK44_ARUDO